MSNGMLARKNVQPKWKYGRKNFLDGRRKIIQGCYNITEKRVTKIYFEGLIIRNNLL